jgi:uncharacterized phage protein (TIGR01671 family)
MKREIKFRALYDSIWYYQTLDEMLMTTLAAFRLGKYKTQFTGLKDKNGKEIYEGDIILFKDYSQSVEKPPTFITSIFWWDEFAGFSVKNTHGELNFMTCDDMEVIGNIYENPELNKE